jgi:hypothetical protein
MNQSKMLSCPGKPHLKNADVKIYYLTKTNFEVDLILISSKNKPNPSYLNEEGVVGKHSLGPRNFI